MQSLLVIGAASQLLAACNTTSALHVPKAQAPTESASLRAADSVATFALDRIVNGIARRDPIFAFPGSPPTSGIYCNITYSGDENVSYANGKRYLGDWSSLFGEIFHEEMTQKGFRIEGDPKAVFSHARQVNQSEYLIGRRLKSMKGIFARSILFGTSDQQIYLAASFMWKSNGLFWTHCPRKSPSPKLLMDFRKYLNRGETESPEPSSRRSRIQLKNSRQTLKWLPWQEIETQISAKMAHRPEATCQPNPPV